MTKANYYEVEQAINEGRAFRGSSCSGFRDEAGAFCVVSYNTLIFKAEAPGVYGYGVKVVYFDNRFYSRTTSRLQGIIKRAYNLAGGVGLVN